MEAKKDLPVLSFDSQAAWESWLAENHADSSGVWLKIAKKDSRIPTVTYEQAVEGALCYGWIDSQGRSYDHQYYLQRFTPRGPKSPWSKINVEKVEALTAAGRMQPAGLRQVELAKADGRWERAYAPQSAIEIPPDFQAALDASPAAREFFDTLNSANRYAFLYRIATAKKPETRAARIQKFIEMLANRQKLYP